MDENLLWDFETCRKKIGKSVQGMRWLIRQRGILGMVRVGRRIYFDPIDVKKWIEENKINFYKGGEK
jgi:hypothetical protein